MKDSFLDYLQTCHLNFAQNKRQIIASEDRLPGFVKCFSKDVCPVEHHLNEVALLIKLHSSRNGKGVSDHAKHSKVFHFRLRLSEFIAQPTCDVVSQLCQKDKQGLSMKTPFVAFVQAQTLLFLKEVSRPPLRKL